MQTKTKRYKGSRDASKGIEREARSGWQPVTTLSDIKVNAGRTMVKGLLTGGVGLLLFGRSKRQEVTVTYFKQ
jgi:hypothetical protein